MAPKPAPKDDKRMKSKYHYRLPWLAALAILDLTLVGAWGGSATASIMSMTGRAEVSVSVGFSTQMPLTDMTDKPWPAPQKEPGPSSAACPRVNARC